MAVDLLRLQLPAVERKSDDHRSLYVCVPGVEPVSCIFTVCYYGMAMDVHPERKKQTHVNGLYIAVAAVCSQFVLHTY